MMRRWLVCCSIAAGVALLAPGGAQGAAGSGTSVLALKGAAAKALSAQGVRVTAVAPATARGTKITFPVTTVTVGSAATLGHAGGLRLRAGKRSITLGAPRLKLSDEAVLLAKVGKSYKTILIVDGTARRINANAGAAGLAAGTVRLTVSGAAAIRKALKLKHLAPGMLGTITVDAKRTTGPATAPGTGTAGATTGSGTTTGTGTGTGAGTGGTGSSGGTTGSGTGGSSRSCTSTAVPAAAGGPSALARSVSAVDATAAGITWHVRHSFIQYIATGEGTAVSGGATADPATVQPGSSAALVYSFHFPFKDGWYDPVSQTTRLTYSGTVTFCYKGHGIELTASAPEVEIAGGSSRAIFTTANTGEAPARGVLVNLDPSGAASITHNGSEHAWNQVPGTIPADSGASTFAGFYAAGDPFGWITVTATT
jgi:hypothetical protein